MTYQQLNKTLFFGGFLAAFLCATFGALGFVFAAIAQETDFFYVVATISTGFMGLAYVFVRIALNSGEF